MTAVHIAVAAAAERRRRVLEAFRKANATSVSRARPQEELGIPDDPVLKDFLKSGAVRRAPDGRLWLDEEALREAQARATRIGLTVAAAMIVLVAVFATIALTRG